MTDMPSPCDFELQLARVERERDQALTDAKAWMVASTYWKRQADEASGKMEELYRTLDGYIHANDALRRRNDELVEALVEALKRP